MEWLWERLEKIIQLFDSSCKYQSVPLLALISTGKTCSVEYLLGLFQQQQCVFVTGVIIGVEEMEHRQQKEENKQLIELLTQTAVNKAAGGTSNFTAFAVNTELWTGYIPNFRTYIGANSILQMEIEGHQYF